MAPVGDRQHPRVVSGLSLAVQVAGAPTGLLAGLRFAVKDVIDLAGVPTTAGTPAWPASHPTPVRHAQVIELLLQAGATLIGKTVSDELAFSINGTNRHYGTPINPAAPSHLPGGSSSGSASVVAAGLAGFALGTDTGGSVRVPASYCGVFGFRPTWGRVSLDGVVPLSPSFDTVGWLGRDAATTRLVGDVLLPRRAQQAWQEPSFIPFAEAFELADPGVARSVREALESRFPGCVSPDRRLGADLWEWARIRRTIQSRETWLLHGSWAGEHADTLGPGVRERLLACSRITEAQYEEARLDAATIAAGLTASVGPDEMLCLPTTPAPAPALDASEAELARQRDTVFALMAPAGLWGAPQIAIPAGFVGSLPVSLGLVAPPDSDRRLLAICTDEPTELSTEHHA